ncbi:hypothetical protein jhhlp_000562 [Lomentospora prolificans]|uniref:Mitochondrial pyruvate carrier n=1 Tax=Lomentospora prolificans TaxID=41688 RepID=A0A2N3NL83_9PEZI|nr:hypothetical protein jhhlp_000562 [Lomentospora prolificans]
MSATRSFLNASRPLFRQPLSSAWRARAIPSRSVNIRNGPNGGSRRWQSTTAGSQAHESWFKRMWNSPVGLKTVHFWAPIMKWAIVIAGISDFARPVEKLSFTQNLALTMTGLIWTRWCLIIKPRNIFPVTLLCVAVVEEVNTLITYVDRLAAVNFFLGCVGTVQITRIAIYEQSKKKSPKPVEDVKTDSKETNA